MALIHLTYCNGSTGRNYAFDYDDAAHSIINVVDVSDCSSGPGAPPGTLLYSHIVGSTQYSVYNQNSYPYAYVSSATILPCSIVITSCTVGNAATNESADGSIIVNITSNYQGSLYSKDDGLNYQSTNTFNNLPAGVYNIRVKGYGPDNAVCYDTEVVTVGYNAVVCHLELGNITVVNPSTIGGSNGSITVNTLVNPIGLVVEYRKDAGAWQDSPVFAALSAGTYSIQVRYKNFTACSNSRNVTVIDASACTLFIQDVLISHEQIKFGDNGQLQIIATSTNGPITYSKDNGGSYQSSNLFQNLSPGSYILKAKDAVNCIDTRTIQILPFKSPYIDIPIVNAHRFVLTAAPGLDTSLQNFDNTLFKDMKFPGVMPCAYYQLAQQGDASTIQFRSNYAAHTLKIIRESNNSVAGVSVVQKKKSFTRQTVSQPVLLADAGANQTQVFFENGLPDWALAGQDITISGTGGALDATFEIQEIRPGTLLAVGYVVAVINVIFPTVGIVGGTVAAEYDIEPFDVWECIVNWSIYANDKYYLQLEGTDVQFIPFIAKSEPVHLDTIHLDTVLSKYNNIDNAHKIFYDTQIVFWIRVQGELKWPLPGGEEVNHEDSNNRIIKLREIVTRNPQLFLYEIPPYLAEKLALICGHDHVVVNGVDYGKQDEKVEISYFESDALCNAKIKIRQVDFIAENSDDAGDVDTPVNVLEVNGVLLKINL